MTEQRHGGNIIPAVARILGKHGEPLTYDNDPISYGYFVEKMDERPEDKIVDEHFAARELSIGRVLDYNPPEQSVWGNWLYLALLEEASGLVVPTDAYSEIIDETVRESGSFWLSVGSAHWHESPERKSDSERDNATYMNMNGTILDNGTVVIHETMIGEDCDTNECRLEESKELKILGRLGLRSFFNLSESGDRVSGERSFIHSTDLVMGVAETQQLAELFQAVVGGTI